MLFIVMFILFSMLAWLIFAFILVPIGILLLGLHLINLVDEWEKKSGG